MDFIEHREYPFFFFFLAIPTQDVSRSLLTPLSLACKGQRATHIHWIVQK
jgi:hypothetical protein